VTRVLAVDAARGEQAAVAEAAALLRAGAIVAFPTESFYGLGVDALDARAVDRLLRAKRRPADKPVLVLVDSIEMAERVAASVPPSVRALMARHWPGPLTLVLEAAPAVAEALTAGTGTIGIRMPGHPVALDLVRAAGRPVTAPSANPSGAPPPTTAEEVRRYFGSEVELILDGGPTAGGTGSTVADCTVWPPRVLRAGPVAVP
jgi:L-threonylcarbamoyladenylate synthase